MPAAVDILQGPPQCPSGSLGAPALRKPRRHLPAAQSGFSAPATSLHAHPFIRIWDLPTRSVPLAAGRQRGGIGGDCQGGRQRHGVAPPAGVCGAGAAGVPPGCGAWWAGAGRALPALCLRPAACGATCEAAVPRPRRRPLATGGAVGAGTAGGADSAGGQRAAQRRRNCLFRAAHPLRVGRDGWAAPPGSMPTWGNIW